MVTAVIIAGGVGSRTGQSIPKQFINIKGKPLLIYTLEVFQNHPSVNKIVVVCLDGWQEMVKLYSKKFGIDKLYQVVTGGSTAQESIRNGVFSLEGKLSDEDIVIVHDGVRPLVDDEVLSDVIATCSKYGNGVTSLPYNEQMFVVGEDKTITNKYIPRETLRRVSTPQAYKFKELDEAYHEAFEKEIGIYGSSYTNTMMVELGKTLHLAAGSDKNIKITTKDDIELFKAFIGVKDGL